MSKRLIKILVICALVVICPIVIVGVSLMSTEAVGYTLNICAIGEEGQDFGGKESSVSIIIDGKVQKDTKMTVTKGTEVTVMYEGVGYEFAGWYKGKSGEVSVDSQNPLNKEGETSYTFTIKKNTNLTAVRNVKTYNVVYAGQYDDQSTDIAIDAQSYYYNQPLATPQAKSDKFALAGWHEYDQAEDIKGENTKVANFASDEEIITLYPTWERQYKFEFYAIGEHVYQGQEGTWSLKGSKGGADDLWVEELGTMMYFMENPIAGYYDLNQNVCDYFINTYSNIKTMNGKDAKFENTVKIYYKVNSDYSILAAEIYLDELSDGVLSFADVLEYVRTKQGSLDQVSLIDVTFLYSEVA